ncbi:Re/Si-specific NAD(P)(+) transhydrogenase subunit alpha [Dyadobacter pollutisoli]|nr:Re/Si-specific NAD(P)(+) transhydrogenase subunit alpha [Dyadobacter pollutisoli]
MKIAVPKETKSFERRVALTPSVVKSIVKSGFTCIVESSAGEESYFSDASYEDAGAVIVYGTPQTLSGADIVLMVNAPTSQEINFMKDGSVLICYLYAYTAPEVIDALNKKRITAFSMDAVPRISRAQKMDALSSQANLAGYKSVLLGANALGRIFPLMMTAAGTITPSRVLVFGAGVAGLQAIATAKRLGAVVEATDVRPETREQVESLGGRFIQVEGVEGVKVEGGYAREVSADYLQKQQELIKSRIKEADIAITTALVIGRKAPILITEEMVRSMKPGSVIVDMAVESGGNCALSVFGKTVVEHGVTIIGEPNLPSLLPVNASELYAKNISTLLLHLANSSGFKWEMEEEITKGSMITHDGELVHGFTKEILAKKNP